MIIIYPPEGSEAKNNELEVKSATNFAYDR